MVELTKEEQKKVDQIFADYYSDRDNWGRQKDNYGDKEFWVNDHYIRVGLKLYVRLISPSRAGDKPAFIYWFYTQD